MPISDIEETYRGNDWFSSLQKYSRSRFVAIHDRYIDTFRFVTPHKENAGAFSYEYAGILRDIGSDFDSSLRLLIRESGSDHAENIGGMLSFLRGFELNLRYISLLFYDTLQLVYPFKPQPDGIPEWWHAYNKIKHQEIENESLGNFKNVTLGLGALFILRCSLLSTVREVSTFTYSTLIPHTLSYVNDFFNST